MNLYLGLGSNLGDRKATLEKACVAISAISRVLRISSVCETPAMLPPGSTNDWNFPFLNLVLEVETNDSPLEFLQKTRQIENSLGRVRTGKWSPRTIDIDLLHAFQKLDTEELVLPHPGIFFRQFVLGPLAEIAPHLVIEGKSVREFSKTEPQFQPRLMGILNITPDSFSDGGKHEALSDLEKTLNEWDQVQVSAVDIGGESTRPGAQLIDEKAEWSRLSRTLEFIHSRYQGKIIKPKISIDTRHAGTAELAIEQGADIINDVSGLSDPGMLQVLRGSHVELVLMHSLSIPPTKEDVLLEDCDPIEAVKVFFEQKINHLEALGISRSRIILDPGIGFGKTPLQSLVLLRRIQEFESLGCQILCGHSRKSFMKSFMIGQLGASPESSRDIETLGISFELSKKGVDWLRVHDPVLHHRAFLAGKQVI